MTQERGRKIIICAACGKMVEKFLSRCGRYSNDFCSRKCSASLKTKSNALAGNTGLTKSTYNNIHTALKKKYGNAKRCVFCDSYTAKRYEWALIKGREYSTNRDDYLELCPSCHRKYDETEESKIKKRDGSPHIPNVTRKGVEGEKDGSIVQFNSAFWASKELGISRTSICNVLANRAKTAGGYTWRYL